MQDTTFMRAADATVILNIPYEHISKTWNIITHINLKISVPQAVILRQKILGRSVMFH